MHSLTKDENLKRSGHLPTPSQRERAPVGAPPTSPLLGQHRALGNQAVQRFAATCPLALPAPSHCPFGGACHQCPPKVQAKLTIGQPGDRYEQEADQVAEAVMRMPDPDRIGSAEPRGRAEDSKVQRSCQDCEEEEEGHRPDAWGTIRRVAAPPTGTVRRVAAPAIVHEALRSPGRALARTARAFFEPRFGRDFSNVRIHADTRASDAARAISAKAFTVGQDMVFRQDHYAPETASGRSLLAHELTHVVQQSGNRTLLQRAETDTVPGCAALVDSQPDVDNRVNASLTAARRTAGTPPSGPAVARGVERDLGRNVQTGRSAVEVWASTLPATKVSLPAQSATKYAGVGYGIWSQPFFPILNPTMKINSICVGSDKLGHFFQQGATYQRTQARSGRPAAEEESERTEGGGFGLQTTGVFSNADMEANRQGGRFYVDLLARPAMTFAISRYISSRWSEVDNPNYYESSVGHQVWANVLRGNWVGTSWPGVPLVPEPLSVTLSATTAGRVTGTISVGLGPVAPGSITNGVITYNTTTVRGSNLFGMNTTATPISGIRIDFDWTLGPDSGKGRLDSSGERHLTGSWGQGTSRTSKGTWDIRHV